MTTAQAQRIAEWLPIVDCLGDADDAHHGWGLPRMTLAEAEALAVAVARTDTWEPLAILRHAPRSGQTDPMQCLTLNIRHRHTGHTVERWNEDVTWWFIGKMRQPVYPGFGR